MSGLLVAHPVPPGHMHGNLSGENFRQNGVAHPILEKGREVTGSFVLDGQDTNHILILKKR
jgi:hypothetical protein